MASWGDDSEEGEISKFNPAQHKMNRLNQLGESINASGMNMKSWNLIYGNWNYFVYFEGVKRVYKESRSKFSDTEKGECDKIKTAVEYALINYPINKKLKNNKWSATDEVHFEKIKKMMEIFENKINDYKDKHGLDTPNMEDDEGL